MSTSSPIAQDEDKRVRCLLKFVSAKCQTRVIENLEASHTRQVLTHSRFFLHHQALIRKIMERARDGEKVSLLSQIHNITMFYLLSYYRHYHQWFPYHIITKPFPNPLATVFSPYFQPLSFLTLLICFLAAKF